MDGYKIEMIGLKLDRTTTHEMAKINASFKNYIGENRGQSK